MYYYFIDYALKLKIVFLMTHLVFAEIKPELNGFHYIKKKEPFHLFYCQNSSSVP